MHFPTQSLIDFLHLRLQLLGFPHRLEVDDLQLLLEFLIVLREPLHLLAQLGHLLRQDPAVSGVFEYGLAIVTQCTQGH
jgi:hypothetical protein